MVRHGETVWNQQRRIQGGTSDTELSERGQKQANRLGLYLKETKINAVYSSPLKRALITAQAIAGHHQLSVQVEPALREIDAGEFEGVYIDEPGTKFSEFINRLRQNGGTEKLPGGESMSDLADRVWSTIQHIIVRHEQQAAIVVSHYFVNAVTIGKALDVPLNCISRIRLQPSSISILDFEDSIPRLVTMGDTCHLRKG